jgi:hypothetical protein
MPGLEQEIDARLDRQERQDGRRAHQEAQDPGAGL